MQKVVELHSLSANAVDGPEWVKCQALVYAWCGERNRALEQLARLENLPASPSLGHLKFSPKWMICAATRASKDRGRHRCPAQDRVGTRTIGTSPKEILKLFSVVLERTDGDEILPNQKP